MIEPEHDIRDRLFDDSEVPVNDFAFDKDVAAVFDDMFDRSVPFYREGALLFLMLVCESCSYWWGYLVKPWGQLRSRTWHDWWQKINSKR